MVFAGLGPPVPNGERNRFALKIVSAEYHTAKYMERWRKVAKREVYWNRKLVHANLVTCHDACWLHLTPQIPNGRLVLKLERMDASLNDVVRVQVCVTVLSESL